MWRVSVKGADGEARAGIVKNTQHTPSYTGKASFRIPDELLPKILKEVKNVAYQGFDSQLQDSLYHALATGRRFTLVVRETTILSKPLQELIRRGFIKLEFLP